MYIQSNQTIDINSVWMINDLVQNSKTEIYADVLLLILGLF